MISAVVLAAGMGTRFNQGQPSKVAKVLYPLAGKPMIMHTLNWVKKVADEIVLVVQHQKEAVMQQVGGDVQYVDQGEPLGTGHAVLRGLEKISPQAEQVLVVNGDDSAFYNEEVVGNLIQQHKNSRAVLTFITLEKQDPSGLGRILRNENGELLGIIEEREATQQQKNIKEVNDGVYLFGRKWLQENLKNLRTNNQGERYLTDLVLIALNKAELVDTFLVSERYWHGVNTPEQLKEADRIMREMQKGNV